MFKRFLSELRHRRVLRAAVAYAIVAAAVVEFTDIVTPALGLPEGLLRAVIIVALAGFPLVIVLAWFFDLTAGGVVRGTSTPETSSSRRTQLFSIMLIGLLATAVVYLSYRLYWESQDQPGFERGMSIAVLPFSSISAEAEPETAYFSDGVAEEILNALSKVEGLRVAARTSSFAFREYDVRDVGEALDVSVVLEGTVRRAGDQLRISAQLVDTGSGFQLWSDVYNHELQDVFQIQEEIAHAIVKALRLELLGATGARLVTPGTDSTQAYDKYLEGRNVLQARTPSAAQKAISIFGEALEFDPSYAQAYAGLADSWILLREVGNLSLLVATQQSHEAITKALQLNAALPEAQASLGLCILGGGGITEAGRQFQKAIELDPEYSDGYLLRANLLRDQGYLAEATRVYTQALALDPFNPAIIENTALLFAFQGRFDTAIEQLTASVEKNPGRLTASLIASRVWALAGDNEKAREHARRAVELIPESPVALAALVEGNVRLGHLDQARAALQRMRDTAPDNETAIIATMRFYLMTGDFGALDSLATSRIERFIDKPGWTGTEFLFERVRWAATARLALGDARGARELLERGIPNPAGLDPRPGAVHTLALLARARSLDGDPQGATEIAGIAGQLIDRARAQGWGGSQLEYALATVAASTDSSARALEHLRDAMEAGWDDFVFANHDPVMLDIVQLPGYRALLK
jgi:TolB-like protein/predicted TPR repeat methyltransferase